MIKREDVSNEHNNYSILHLSVKETSCSVPEECALAGEWKVLRTLLRYLACPWTCMPVGILQAASSLCNIMPHSLLYCQILYKIAALLSNYLYLYKSVVFNYTYVFCLCSKYNYVYTMTLWTHNVMCLVHHQAHQFHISWCTHNHSCHVVQSKNLPTSLIYDVGATALYWYITDI